MGRMQNVKHLDELLKKHAEKQAVRKAETEKDRQIEDQFLADFQRFYNDVANPLMQEFADKLKTQGFDCHISYRPEQTNHQGAIKDAMILFEANPPGTTRSYDFQNPCYTLYAVRYKRKVMFHESTLGGRGSTRQSGSVAEFEMKSVTAALLEKYLIVWLEHLL